jgi:hypothetical protein
MTAHAFSIRQELVHPAPRRPKRQTMKPRFVAGPLKALVGLRNLRQALDPAVALQRRREIAQQSGHDAQAQKVNL